MATRQGSMATIDAALATPIQSEPTTAPPPAIAPPPPAETVKQSKEQIAKQEKTAQQEAQQQGEALRSSTKQLWDATKNIWSGTKVTLEGLPTPGSMIFPLIVLLVFFFFLLPVNGHTRIVWLWLTLSGNAKIAPGQTTTGVQPTPLPSTTPTSTNNTTPFANNGNVVSIPNPFASPIITGHVAEP